MTVEKILSGFHQMGSENSTRHNLKPNCERNRSLMAAVLLSSCLVCEQSSESEVHFDVEIAIKVLRQASYHSHAVFLAEKHMHHEWYLKIQLEDLKVKKMPVDVQTFVKQMYSDHLLGLLRTHLSVLQCSC